MKNISRLFAIGVMGLGVIIMAVGFVNWQKANAGLKSLDAVYKAQNVTLSYNEDGQLTDHGTVEGAQEIMTRLTDEWQYPVNMADFDPNDPLVNTPSELMYQFATITTHTLDSTQTVVLDEPVEANGQTYDAGTYEFNVDGRYWSDFDRSNPIEAAARGLAWNGTVHGLLAEISAGVAADYEAGFAHFAAWRTVLVGLAIGLGGAGLFTLSLEKKEEKEQTKARAKDAAVTA